MIWEEFLKYQVYGKTWKPRHPLYKGFKLKIKYPGCGREVGDFEPYTSGEFLKYPEIWEPQFHDDVLRDNKINQILDESDN